MSGRYMWLQLVFKSASVDSSTLHAAAGIASSCCVNLSSRAARYLQLKLEPLRRICTQQQATIMHTAPGWYTWAWPEVPLPKQHLTGMW